MDSISNKELYQLKRKRKGIKLTEIASLIGCHQSTLSRYENGKYNISAVLERKYRNFIDEK